MQREVIRFLGISAGQNATTSLGLERPVLFVDVPRKVNNPRYGEIDCEPLEVSIRGEIGEVVSPDQLDQVPARIRALCSGGDAFAQRIRQLRSELIYHVGHSKGIGADCIAQLADEMDASKDCA